MAVDDAEAAVPQLDTAPPPEPEEEEEGGEARGLQATVGEAAQRGEGDVFKRYDALAAQINSSLAELMK